MKNYRRYRNGGMNRRNAVIHALEDWYYDFDRWWN